MFSTGKPANMSNSAFKNITRGVRLRLLAHRKYGRPFEDILQPSVIHGTPFNDALCPVAPPPLPPRGAQPPPNAGSVSAASTLPSDQTMTDQFRLFACGKPADWSNSVFKQTTRGVRLRLFDFDFLRLLAHRKHGHPINDMLPSPQPNRDASTALAGLVSGASTLPSVPFDHTMADQFRFFACDKPADWSNSVFKQATRGVRLRLLAHRKYGQPINDMILPSAQPCRNASPALPTVATGAPVACHGLPSRGADPLSPPAFNAPHSLF